MLAGIHSFSNLWFFSTSNLQPSPMCQKRYSWRPLIEFCVSSRKQWYFVLSLARCPWSVLSACFLCRLSVSTTRSMLLARVCICLWYISFCSKILSSILSKRPLENWNVFWVVNFLKTPSRPSRPYLHSTILTKSSLAQPYSESIREDTRYCLRIHFSHAQFPTFTIHNKINSWFFSGELLTHVYLGST